MSIFERLGFGGRTTASKQPHEHTSVSPDQRESSYTNHETTDNQYEEAPDDVNLDAVVVHADGGSVNTSTPRAVFAQSLHGRPVFAAATVALSAQGSESSTPAEIVDMIERRWADIVLALRDDDAPPAAIVEYGGSLWEAARSLVERGIMNEQQYQEAWTSQASSVRTAHGRQPLAEGDDAYAGAVLMHDADTPRFVVRPLAQEAVRFDDHDAVLRVYYDNDLEVPGWLRDALGLNRPSAVTAEIVALPHTDQRMAVLRSRFAAGSFAEQEQMARLLDDMGEQPLREQLVADTTVQHNGRVFRALLGDTLKLTDAAYAQMRDGSVAEIMRGDAPPHVAALLAALGPFSPSVRAWSLDRFLKSLVRGGRAHIPPLA